MECVSNAMGRIENVTEGPWEHDDLDRAGRTMIEDVIIFMAYLAEYDCDFFECVISGDIDLKIKRIPKVVQLDESA